MERCRPHHPDRSRSPVHPGRVRNGARAHHRTSRAGRTPRRSA